MAGSNTDEDENYWPGYVDALTTMTMVLTFLMMVLGVMVFVLSQESASSKISAIARVLKVEKRQLENLNQVEVEEALRRALARRDTGEGGSGANQRGARAVASEAADKVDEQLRPATGIVGAPGQGPDSLSREAGQQNAASSDTLTHGERQTVSSYTGGVEGKRTAGPGGEYFVTNQSTGVAGQDRGVGGRLEPGPGALRFVFERDAIDLPPAVAEALQAYVAAQGPGSLVVEASAVAKESGPTDARRKAYFRAMLIRSRLIKIGVDPLLISVRVRDAAQVSALETVDVMKPQASGG